MTIGNKIAWDDTVLPFQLDRADIRGRVARLDGVLDSVLEQHDYPPAIEALVAEMTLLTALIGQTMKSNWKLSLQVRGSGPARLIATDYYGPASDGDAGRVRAYASYDDERIEPNGPGFAQLGSGYFAILIDQGEGTKPYQGITPIAGKSLSECAETYFAQSEQLATRFELTFGRSTEKGGVEGWRAGGMMLQHMPKASPFAKKDEASGEEGLLAATDMLNPDEEDNWNRANILLDSVEQLELIGPVVSPTQLLVRLFHEETPRVYNPQPVVFGCSCSAERVATTLSIYSPKDLAYMTKDDGSITADCQFCGAHYVLDPATVGRDVVKNADGAGA